MTYYSDQLPHTSDKLSGFDRIKIDVAQTSFFEGREFRTFKEFSIAVAATYVIRVVVAADIILNQIQLDLDAGAIRMGTYVGGTPGGSFLETIPSFMRNNMSIGPNKRFNPTSGVVITAGGTHTGGTELDVLRVRTSTNIGNQSSTTVGASAGDERGIAANTYYFRLNNFHATDTATGTLHVAWEERMAPPPSAYA